MTAPPAPPPPPTPPVPVIQPESKAVSDLRAETRETSNKLTQVLEVVQKLVRRHSNESKPSKESGDRINNELNRQLP